MLLVCNSLAFSEDLSVYHNDMKTLSYDGVNIKYIDRGAGQPLLLLHGFGASSYSWRYIIDKFSVNYRVIAIDLKGFGLSGKPTDEKYSPSDQSQIIINFIKDLGLKDVILVGHSFGGAVALFSYLEMQKSNYTPVVKMILIDSASYKQEFPYFIQILRTPLLNRLTLFVLPDKVNANMLLKKAFYDDSKITKEMINIYASYLGLAGAYHALIKTSELILPKNIDDIVYQYKQINIPTLVIWGDKDEIVPLEVGQRLSRDISTANLHIIKDCGHVPQEECPVETIRLFEGFLEGNR